MESFGSGLSIPELVAKRAETNPDRIAIHDLTTATKLSYEGLHRDVLAWARGLAGQGVRAGDRVVMVVPNTAEGYALWLAIAWLRTIPVPLNIEFRGNMLQHVTELSGARLAVVASAYVERLVEIRSRLTHLETIVVQEGEPPSAGAGFRFVARDDLLGGGGPAIDVTPPSRDEPAVVIFTGGTTGPSKGALVAWGYFTSYGDLPPAIQGDNCRLYSTWPVWHSSGHYGLANSVYRNGTLVLRDRWHTQQFWPDVRGSDATGTMLLGGVANLVWQAAERADDRDNPLQHLSIQPIIMDHTAFERRFDVKVQSGYGMSEAGTVLLCQHPLPNDRTCGVVTPGYEVRLVDEHGSEVPPGVMGELWVRSEDPTLLFREYLNMPEATAEAWQDGWFRTRDGFERDEAGYFYFRDRLKDCIRRRGENISSMELEKEINAHPDVVESAAVAARDEHGGEEVLAFVVCRQGGSLGAEELLAFLEPRLPRFMVPRYVELVDELPKTPASGRVRKLELRKRGLGARTWDRETGALVGQININVETQL